LQIAGVRVTRLAGIVTVLSAFSKWAFSETTMAQHTQHQVAEFLLQTETLTVQDNHPLTEE